MPTEDTEITEVHDRMEAALNIIVDVCERILNEYAQRHSKVRPSLDGLRHVMDAYAKDDTVLIDVTGSPEPFVLTGFAGAHEASQFVEFLEALLSVDGLVIGFMPDASGSDIAQTADGIDDDPRR